MVPAGVRSGEETRQQLHKLTDDELLTDKHSKLLDDAYAHRDEAIRAIMEKAPFQALKIPLRSPPGTWAIVHPFVKRPGTSRWQASLFDARGPWSDMVQDTIPQLLVLLFRYHDPEFEKTEVVYKNPEITETRPDGPEIPDYLRAINENLKLTGKRVIGRFEHGGLKITLYRVKQGQGELLLWSGFSPQGILEAGGRFFRSAEGWYAAVAAVRPEYQGRGIYPEVLKYLRATLPKSQALITARTISEGAKKAWIKAGAVETVPPEHPEMPTRMELRRNPRTTVLAHLKDAMSKAREGYWSTGKPHVVAKAPGFNDARLILDAGLNTYEVFPESDLPKHRGVRVIHTVGSKPL